MNEIETKLAFIRKKFPDIARDKKITINTEGSSNLVLIVGKEWIFRFPKNEEAKKGLESELLILPQLKKKLSIAIPDFTYHSLTDDGLSYVGYRMIKGEPLMQEYLFSLSKDLQDRFAKDIGKFLRRMHRFPWKVYSPNQTAQSIKKGLLTGWESRYEMVKKKVFPKINSAEIKWTANLFDNFIKNYHDLNFTPCLIHGDLKRSHILVDKKAAVLTGVIDFGSMGVVDPAQEFIGLYSSYGEDFVKQILSYYQPKGNEAFLQRIRDFYYRWGVYNGLIYAVNTNNADSFNRYYERLKNIINNTDPVS